MPGNGLLPCGSSDRPVPLPLAAKCLSQALNATDAPPLQIAAEQPRGWLLLRVEVAATALGPRATLALDWLAAQRTSKSSASGAGDGLVPRVLFGARDGSELVAGVGAAHIHRVAARSAEPAASGFEPRTHTRLLPQLSKSAHECIRYFGGLRFDACDAEAQAETAAEWEAFGDSFWVLPRVELCTGQSALQSSENGSASSEISLGSMSSLNYVGGLMSSDGCPMRVVMAVNLRWRADGGVASWITERGRALSALSCLRVVDAHIALPITLAGRSEAASQKDFERRVQEALDAFKSGELKKVVLARRILMEMVREPDPVEFLRQVIGDGQKRSYLFLLEPEAGTAFVSVTPERLCKIHNRDVWTEAVAGTWPLAEFEQIGEAALLASSEKHSSEHRLVVDYICNLLDDVSEHVKVCDTHILKLKHLVHIKQSFHSIAKDQEQHGDLHDTDLAAWFCENVSPTPAVAGLPLQAAHRFIRNADGFDRGLYAAPCGVVGGRGAELVVAIRSALVRGHKAFVYAGAGIVPGSVAAEEFAEISLKMKQFTDAIPVTTSGLQTAAGRLDSFMAAPNINSLWAALFVEECVRNGLKSFVICPGSRSTPLVVAVARHPHVRYVINHDERGAAYYALGWAKGTCAPVGVIVTSGTAVANLLPGAVEASLSSVPLLLITADRPHELRDTGSNQTITQTGIFGVNVRWAKEFPPPSTEYPAHAFLGDIDLAVAHSRGGVTGHPGPVHLNFCFRENLAPEGGQVRGAPERSSSWDSAYLDTPAMSRWVGSNQPRSIFVQPSLDVTTVDAVLELAELARASARILVLVGSLRNYEETLIAEDIALRLHAAVFADITSGLRQRPFTVGYADQLLNSPLLAGDLLQIDAVVHLGGPVCSARLQAFIKAAAAPLHLRVAPVPTRLDSDFTVTQHLPCSLRALALALIELGLDRASEPSRFWRQLSASAGEELEEKIAGHTLTEPFVAHTVSRLIPPRNRLLISSSMPIRDLDFYAQPYADLANQSPAQFHPPLASRGASGIDGVLSTAIGFCTSSGTCATLVIGDTAFLHDMNALQQLASPVAPALTIVLVNNSGGGIFSFLPIAKHRDAFSPCFDAPHNIDFASACEAFGVRHILCETPAEFESAYVQAQHVGRGARPLVIEARVQPSHESNVALHKELGQAVANRVKQEILQEVQLSWTYLALSMNATETIVLLHGWLGSKADWVPVAELMAQAGRNVLLVDLPGHGATRTSLGRWENATLFSMPVVVELLVDLLNRLRIGRVVVAGYSLGGRVAMALAEREPERVSCTIALSANPGLTSNVEKRARWYSDKAIARRLKQMPPDDGAECFSRFLDDWYAQPIWGNLLERRPDVLRSLRERRKCNCPQLIAHSLMGLSLARQPSYWPSMIRDGGKLAPPLQYACGTLDSKFAAIGQKLSNFDTNAHSVVELQGAGHALVEELPQQVADICMNAVGPGEVAEAPDMPPKSPLILCSAFTRPLRIALKAPLMLSRGDPMPERCGLLLILQGRMSLNTATNEQNMQNDEHLLAGLGEISPLPSFHKETLEEAEAQLKAILATLGDQQIVVPWELLRLDGSMQTWLQQQFPRQALLPSVRAGLEMALLHLLGRATKAPHLAFVAAAARGLQGCSSHLHINSLLAREEELAGPGGADVVKVKVGKVPIDDAERINKIAALLKTCKGNKARLRLDANQAWTIDQASLFVEQLLDETVALIEYIEEPIVAVGGPANLVQGWKELSDRTRQRLRLAVDESLTENGIIPEEHLSGCIVPLAAVILKPALQGLEQTMELAAWCAKNGVRPVLSSAFESGVALAHFSILASAAGSPPWAPAERKNGYGHVSACHGLGTFTRLAEDVLCPPFADLTVGGRGWCVDPLQCQKALDETTDILVNEQIAQPL